MRDEASESGDHDSDDRHHDLGNRCTDRCLMAAQA
jgi:hypothetical protein